MLEYENYTLLDSLMAVTSLGFCRISSVVVVARRALLLPGLSCKVSESPVTN